jgi:N-acetylmuramoyl-L-alanine amidase
MKNYCPKLFLILITIVSFSFVKPNPTSTKKINVVIDAGHGGYDSGATLDEVTEKLITEQISKKIKSLNKNQNIIIHLTRNGDEFLSLEKRASVIHSIQPDLVLSLHVNASPNKEKSGVEFYIGSTPKSNEKSNELAQKLNTKFAENNNFKTSEIKKASFYILKNTQAPAIIAELGYLTNDNDKKYLTDDIEQNKIAASILELISELE